MKLILGKFVQKVRCFATFFAVHYLLSVVRETRVSERRGERHPMQFIPVLVLMVLFFVMMFGIGFILNMLMKTTWFPSYLFIIVILPVVVYSLWDHTASLMSHLGSFHIVDYMTGVAGLAGALISGWAIRKLRLGGYKMF